MPLDPDVRAFLDALPDGPALQDMTLSDFGTLLKGSLGSAPPLPT